MVKIFKGDIVYVKLPFHSESSVQAGLRPCLVVSSYPSSPVVNVIPFTAKLDKKPIPVHIEITPENVKGYLEKTSLALVEQITTVDKKNIQSKLGYISPESEIMSEIEEALIKQLKLSGAGGRND